MTAVPALGAAQRRLLITLSLRLRLFAGLAGVVLLGVPFPSAAGGGTLPLQGKVVTIDPGHNPNNYLHTREIDKLVSAGGGGFLKACDTTGTETASGYTEADYTFDVATRLAKLLRNEGAKVVLTRNAHTPWGPCINQRAAIGNRAHSDAAISIHADGGPVSGRGFHVIYPPDSGITRRIAIASQRLALDVRNAYRRGTGMPYANYIGHDGLDVRNDLGGLNLSTVPKVFIETGNMRSPTDAALLESSSFRMRAAQALANGLTAFLR
jgi:N-acetylmuramoyl-L-alanine amidase